MMKTGMTGRRMTMTTHNTIEEIVSERLQERYYKLRHRSGLTVYVMPKPMVSSYAVLAARCGSIDNRFRRHGDGRIVTVPDGCAHFLEHKLFAQCGGEDATARFARLGASADAYTTPDTTAFLFSCTENTEQSLRVLLDFVTHPYFTEENVERERSIIAEELRMYEDTPSQLAYYNLMEALYHTNPIRVDIGGTLSSIETITPEILYTFYDTFYHLSNMTLVAAGGFTPEEVMRICDELLPDAPDGEPVSRLLLPEPREIVKPYVSARAQLAVPLVYLGVKDPDISPDPVERMKKSAAADVANDILFSNSSRFFNEMYEKGILNARFGADFEHTADFSYVLLSAETAYEEEYLDRIRNYLAKQRRDHTITKAQFERCKRVMYACAVTVFESTEDMAGSCLSLALDGGELFASADITAELKIDDVFDALDSLYEPERYAVSVVNPQKD